MPKPPRKPLLIYDGRCSFCKIWIDYWKKLTDDRIDYAPSQEVGDRYPQISPAEFSKSVQFVREDGTIASGARAVFESLGHKRFYESSRVFAWISEWFYGIVARHRDFFYHLTKWTFGATIEPARFALTQWVFVRMLCVIYAIAFGSLSVQITGLLGSRGILPVADYLKLVAENVGVARYFYVPTLFWAASSDQTLRAVCFAGIAVAILTFLGLFQRAGLALLFVLYLSLSSAGQDFLSFQWDALLLESGFLAVFLGRAQIVPWLFRALAFRLYFLSGAVKLTSGDPNWRNLSALSFHYYTQPLPNVISWYFEQMPLWFHRMSTFLVLGVELVIPFLIFVPRRLRIFGAWWLLTLQALIFLTGNYTFFNLLAAALCIFLFDDRALERILPKRFWKPAPGATGRIERAVAAVLTAVVLVLGISRIIETVSGQRFEPLHALVRYSAPFEIVNSYGLFAVMTTQRPEIIVEGSMDGENWQAYEFRYKPGDLAVAPKWVAPFQPRLDWQMWFAALSNYRENPWFVNFAVRLLEGSPDVRALLAHDPFNGRNPQYIRALVYDYRFTDSEERKKTGNWWRRENRGMYLPAVGLRREAELHD